MKRFLLTYKLGIIPINQRQITLSLFIVFTWAGLTACDFFDRDKPPGTGVDKKTALAPPQKFQSQVQGSKVTLTWQQLSDLEYNLYMASEPGVTPLTIDRLNNGIVHEGVNSPFTLSALQEGATYYFVITAIGKQGESEPSIEISATPLSITAPIAKPSETIEPPKNLQADAGDQKITLTWEPVPGATQYNLYMATEYGINPKLYSQLHDGMAHLNVSSPYTIYGLKNHVVHYFVIAAVDENGEGQISPEVFATPSPPMRPPTPRNFSAQAGNGQITLYWDSHPQIERYNIYSATKPGVTADAYSRLPGSVTVRNITSPYVFRGLTNGTNYYFILTGETDASGESLATEEISATPRLPQLPPPGNIQVLAADRKIIVRWQKSIGAERYNVYMAQQPGVSPDSIKNISGGVVFEGAVSPFEIADLQNGTTYYIAITAENNIQESKPSEEFAAIPKKPYIPPPPRSQVSIDNYTILDNSGHPLPDQSKAYPLQPWECVQSKKSGLVWEVKSAEQGLRYYKHTYTWYHPAGNVNLGNPGVINGGKCVGSGCDIYAYIQAINNSKLCGFDDWRLPTRDELLTLVDTKATYPRATIDIDAFPNAANSYYWTSTVYEFDPNMAWFVYFGSGYDYYEYKTFASHVRLVRGP
ncbi:Lcl domain-containing protein [Kaarinaea lacus]